MVLNFEKQPLSQALQVLQATANSSTTLPILSNVMITANDDGIEISASDLEVGIRRKVDGVVEEGGTITVLASKLVDVVKDLPDSEIRFTTTSNDRVLLECGNGKYRIIGLDSDEFPMQMVDSESDEYLQIEGDVFRQLLERTEFAASTDEVRYFLNGIYFNFLEDRTDVVATDGTQLAIAQCDPLTPPEGVSNFIIPLKAVKELAKTFAESSMVNVALTENVIIFSDDVSVLTTRIIEGEYPKYGKIIPEASEIEGYCTADRKELLKALTRVSHLSNPKNFSICLEMTEGAEDMVISTRTPDLGDAEEVVGVYECSKNLRIGFDSRKIKDALDHMDSPTVRMEYSGELKPFIIRPVESGQHTVLAMPMRIASAD